MGSVDGTDRVVRAALLVRDDRPVRRVLKEVRLLGGAVLGETPAGQGRQLAGKVA